jgi:putative heme iron utilization protein
MSSALEVARAMISERRTAALGTLHGGEPSVSMVPFAVTADGSGIVVHVSALSAHTADMLASPRVSLLIAAAESDDMPPQALPRMTVRGDAERLEGEAASAAREAYLGRFPDAAPIFALPDFSLFLIRPHSVRVIGGFGAAATLTGDDCTAALRNG